MSVISLPMLKENVVVVKTAENEEGGAQLPDRLSAHDKPSEGE